MDKQDEKNTSEPISKPGKDEKDNKTDKRFAQPGIEKRG